MMKLMRQEYRRRRDKSVWHFMQDCRFWPDLPAALSSIARPKSGTLCDYCQHLEKKSAKALK